MTTEATPTKPARAPRQPTDRAVKKSEQMQADALPPAGWDTLKPVTEMRSGELGNVQADMLELFSALGIDLEHPGDAQIETTPDVLRAVSKLGSLLEENAVDVDAFIKVDTGSGAQERILELAMWYMAQMGESDGSAT